MSQQSSAPPSAAIGFTGLLAIAFIVLKVTREIDWSWWWVLSPLWIGAAITAVVFAVIVVVALIVAGC